VSKPGCIVIVIEVKIALTATADHDISQYDLSKKNGVLEVTLGTLHIQRDIAQIKHALVLILAHTSIQHSRRDIPPTTFLLQGVETLQDNTFPMGETVSDIRKIVTRVTGRHMKVSPCRVCPEFRAECCDGTWRSSPTLF
jgi:hypothetical protein